MTALDLIRPLAVATAVWLAATPSLAADAPAPVVGAHGLALPATFTGTLPCADCAGVAHHLDLLADQTYQMRREWLGKDEPLIRDEVGRWHADPARGAIVLSGASEAPQFWEVRGEDRLRQMDLQGQPIVSDLDYELQAGPLDETDLSLFLDGMVTYMADAALFEECLTGRSYPVALEGAWIELERAYLGAVEGGTPLYATFDGTVSMKEGMEGGPRRTVTVDRFVEVVPGRTCERAASLPALTDTFWRIERLGELPVVQAEGWREPYLLFLPGEDGGFSATAGCNLMRGSYRTEESSLSFGPAASTMMACPPPLDEAERALTGVFPAVAEWRIEGGRLTLLDADGTVLAELQAVYLP